jgi:DNA mismatch repair protein PMS2
MQPSAPAIAALSATDIHRICSGQVILSLVSGVKELLENALDAHATRVEIKLTEHGFESFEVVDDGVGIAMADRGSVALKHWTSKLATFEDLTKVGTFGFRGEALSSLCETAGGLVVTTRTREDAAGERLEFDHTGALVGRNVASRGLGTTVTVSNLFANLPVGCGVHAPGKGGTNPSRPAGPAERL